MLPILNLCLRFLALPLLAACFLAIEHLTNPAPTAGFTKKLGAALAMYGLGSIIPYFLSDEILHRKFGEVSNSKDTGYTVSFATQEAKDTFDFTKNFLWSVFIVGVFLWMINHILPVRLATSQPTLSEWVWTTGVGFCILAGVLFVILNSQTNLTPGPPSSMAGTSGGISQQEKTKLNPIPANFENERDELERAQKEEVE